MEYFEKIKKNKPKPAKYRKDNHKKSIRWEKERKNTKKWEELEEKY